MPVICRQISSLQQRHRRFFYFRILHRYFHGKFFLYLCAGGNTTFVQTFSGKVFGWGQNIIPGKNPQDPIELKIENVRAFSRMYAWGAFVFLEDVDTGNWFANCSFFENNEPLFQPLTELNQDERVKGNIN